MAAVFKRLDGRNGRIEIPHLGALIANIASWTLIRRADQGLEADFYDLHAVLSFVNVALFNDRDYEKVVTIQPSKGRSYVLEPQVGPGQRTVLTGRSLVMERVKLCQTE